MAEKTFNQLKAEINEKGLVSVYNESLSELQNLMRVIGLEQDDVTDEDDFVNLDNIAASFMRSIRLLMMHIDDIKDN